MLEEVPYQILVNLLPSMILLALALKRRDTQLREGI